MTELQDRQQERTELEELRRRRDRWDSERRKLKKELDRERRIDCRTTELTEVQGTTKFAAGKVATEKAAEERETQRLVLRLTEEQDLLRAAVETDEAESVHVLTDRDVAREEKEAVGRVVVRLTAWV